jgi:hypothetical protein
MIVYFQVLQKLILYKNFWKDRGFRSGKDRDRRGEINIIAT